MGFWVSWDDVKQCLCSDVPRRATPGSGGSRPVGWSVAATPSHLSSASQSASHVPVGSDLPQPNTHAAGSQPDLPVRAVRARGHSLLISWPLNTCFNRSALQSGFYDGKSQATFNDVRLQKISEDNVTLVIKTKKTKWCYRENVLIQNEWGDVRL